MLENKTQSVVSARMGEVAESLKGEAKKTQAYSAPRIFEIGKAVDLLQGHGGWLSDSHASDYRD